MSNPSCSTERCALRSTSVFAIACLFALVVVVGCGCSGLSAGTGPADSDGAGDDGAFGDAGDAGVDPASAPDAHVPADAAEEIDAGADDTQPVAPDLAEVSADVRDVDDGENGAPDDGGAEDGDTHTADATDGADGSGTEPPRCEPGWLPTAEGCTDRRNRPCRRDEDCGDWRCGPGSYCVTREAFPVRLAQLDTALAGFPWGDPLAGSDLPSDYFAQSTVLADLPGTPGWLAIGASGPIARGLCVGPLSALVDPTASVVCSEEGSGISGLAPVASSAAGVELMGARGADVVVARVAAGAAPTLAWETVADARCRWGHAAAVDIGADGVPEVVVECDEFSSSRSHAGSVTMLRSDGAGTWAEPAPSERPPAFARWTHRLALARLDADVDGLVDAVSVNDSFSSPAVRNTLLEPGRLIRSCAPDETCELEVRSVADGIAAWGSFMGAATIEVEGAGTRLLLSDLGPTRLLDLAAPDRADEAAARGIVDGFERDEFGTRYVFSWSLVVEDFDMNGTDDVFITRGNVDPNEVVAGEGPAHFDELFLQDETGTFASQRDEGWVAADGLALSRGAVSVDLDLDGRMEVLISRWYLPPVLLEEEDVGQPLRCTVRAWPSVVPSVGWGLSSSPFREGPWRDERVDGDMNVRVTHRFVTALREGWVRFASGAVMPFDCGEGPGPVDLVEPDWLAIAHAGATLRVVVDPSIWPSAPESVEVALRGERPMDVVPLARVDASTWEAAIAERPERVMVRIDGRWVGVWLPVGCP